MIEALFLAVAARDPKKILAVESFG